MAQQRRSLAQLARRPLNVRLERWIVNGRDTLVFRTAGRRRGNIVATILTDDFFDGEGNSFDTNLDYRGTVSSEADL